MYSIPLLEVEYDHEATQTYLHSPKVFQDKKPHSYMLTNYQEY